MRFDAVLFDVDGTLLDTSEGILLSVKDTIEHFDLPRLSEEQMLKFIGPPIEWSFEGKCGVMPDRLRDVTNYFRDVYSNKNLLLAKPYDGIYDLLDYLNHEGILIGIATYKKQDYAEKLLNAMRFNEYTSHIFGSDYEGRLLKSDIIDICIRSLGAKDRSRVLMVGDSKHDAKGALMAGCPFAGVSYGFGFGDFGGEVIGDYGHVFYAHDVSELKSFIGEE